MKRAFVIRVWQGDRLSFLGVSQTRAKPDLSRAGFEVQLNRNRWQMVDGLESSGGETKYCFACEQVLWLERMVLQSVGRFKRGKLVGWLGSSDAKIGVFT